MDGIKDGVVEVVLTDVEYNTIPSRLQTISSPVLKWANRRFRSLVIAF